VPYVRTVKTSSGATAVQIVYSCHRGPRQIEHIGSAHDDAELELLKAVARQRLAAGQGVLDLGPGFGGGAGGPLPITASRMGCLLDALSRACEGLGFGRAAGGDEVFRDLVLARIIEPVSKLDSLRVLEEAGVAPASYAHAEAAAAGLCEGLLAAEDLRCLRRPCRARPGEPGALRRQHFVLRDRRW
jgi:hypothetical protein